jgi:hypothetical protein
MPDTRPADKLDPDQKAKKGILRDRPYPYSGFDGNPND